MRANWPFGRLVHQPRDARSSQPADQPRPSIAAGPDDLLDASLRPALHAGRRFRFVVGLLVVVVAIGVVAYIRQLTGGLAVTGKNDDVFWGLYTTSLVTFIGFSYGGALVSAILRLTNASWRGPVTRIAEATALATLAIGALFPIIHLGRPERVWEILVRPQIHSPILWDLVAISTYMVATIVLFGLPLVADFGVLRDRPEIGRWRRRLYAILSFGWRGTEGQRAALERALTIVAILIVPLAVVVHTVLSYAFSLTSRPGWHSTIFGPYFVIGAVYSGIAVVIVATVAYRRAYRLQRWIDDRVVRNLGYLLAALAIAYGYATFTELTTTGYVSESADADVLYAMVLARYAPLFWAFVGFGLIIPILAVALPLTRTPTALAIASLLVIGSMYVKRLLIIVPPLTRPIFGEAAGSYSPTWVEIAVVSGAAAGIVLIILLLFRVVPILSINEIHEIERSRADPTRVAAPAPSPIAAVGEVSAGAR